MATPGIVFDHVWKKFRRGEVHDSLRDLMPALARRLVGRAGADREQLGRREFWALSDVAFEVVPGQALGIIGANGAGKSTVLKVLNGILRPTRGYCELRGRAGSLIEISAGFHPDLTGRQNVFLQGSIMGMRTAETQRKFDQIVDFAGIGDAIDTPVKRYSSGMNARLGFSIAAHLDPDVLIIDEVLAVGDLSFQDRAFGRIKELAQSGIPVVLVSHQLERLSTLCTNAILLEKGRVVKRGTPEECIATYATALTEHAGGTEEARARITRLEILSPLPIPSGGHLRYRIRGVIEEGAPDTYDPFHVRIRSARTGKLVFWTLGTNCGLERPPAGEFEAEVELQLNVSPGIYTVETTVHDTAKRQEASRGPIAHVQVSSSTTFGGTVQMNPAMELVAHRPPQALGGTVERPRHVAAK
jgi:ABC-type polysaccharide/polyol phosphate transport system ATPase subunit